MVGDGEHGKPRHASGLQRASQRAFQRAFAYQPQEERQQEQKRQVQGRRGDGGDNAGRPRRRRFGPEHPRRRLRDRLPRQPPRDAALLLLRPPQTGLARTQTHDLEQDLR